MLNYLIFFPLISAFVVLLLNRGGVKVFSVVVSFMILALNLDIFADFLQGISFDYNLSFKILKFFSFHVGVDSIALILMLLSSLMIFLSFLFLKLEQKALVSCIFFLEFAIMGLFSAKDGLLFYVFGNFLFCLCFILWEFMVKILEQG